jgi:hypothetical protein
MKRFGGVQKEMAKVLDLRPPAPRRKPLSEEAIRSTAVQGCLEYLAELTDYREGAEAEQLLAELEEIPVGRLGESILLSMENLLIERHPRGGMVFHTLRSRAPSRLGRGYAMYRIFQDPEMVVEELFEDFIEYTL